MQQQNHQQVEEHHENNGSEVVIDAHSDTMLHPPSSSTEQNQDEPNLMLKSEGSSDSYNQQRQYSFDHSSSNNATHTRTLVMVNLIELAIVALGSSISAAKPIQRLSLHPYYADEDSLFTAIGPSSPSEEMMVQSETMISDPSTAASIHNNKPFHTPNTHHRRDDSIRLKLDGTVVTDADGAAQRIICSSLQQSCQHVRIVAEESKLEAEISSHNVRDRVWSGLSPITKRRLMTEEEEQQDDIMNGARQEIYQRIHQVTRKRHWLTRGPGQQGTQSYTECHPQEQYYHHHFPSIYDHGNEDHDNNNNNKVEMEDNIETLLSMYNVDAHRVAIFVDPLDGTGCYAKGEYDAVTILTAIVLDNTPIFGIICKPFAIDFMTDAKSTCTTSSSAIYNSFARENPFIDFTHTFLNSGCFVVYGGTLLQGAFIAGNQELETSLLFYQKLLLQEKEYTHENDDDALSSSIVPQEESYISQRKAIISKSRSGGVVAKCIESLSKSRLLSSEPIHIAGAGYKALRLLLGYEKECLWFFPKPGTSLWDVAAADALLQVVGGRLTDKYSRPLDYSKARLEAENLDGIVASNDRTLHEICIRRYQDEAWSDDEE